MKILELQNFFKIAEHLQKCINFTIHSSKDGTDLYLFYVIADESVISSGFILNARQTIKRYATLKSCLADIFLLNQNFAGCNFVISTKIGTSTVKTENQVLFNRRSTDRG